MLSKQEIHPLENGLRHYPSRTVQVFKTTHLTRILREILQSAPSITAGMAEWVKHCQSIHSDLIWEYFQSIDYEADTSGKLED